MKLRYFGHSCFQLVSDNGVRIVTDPYTRVGYELRNDLSADVVTVSHGHFDHAFVQGVGDDPFVLDGRGNVFRFEDVEITSFETFHDEKQGALRGKNQIFQFTVDGVKLCHFGDLGEPCRANILEKIGKVDVLMLPVGGTYTIDARQAKEYVDKLGAKLVVPMHFKPDDGALDITPVDEFLALCDEDEIEKIDGETEITIETLSKTPARVLCFERVK